MRYFAALVLALALVGCTPEQNESTGKKLNTAGQVVEQVKEVVREIPVPGSKTLEIVLGAISAGLTLTGGWLVKKAKAERTKKKAYKGELSKTGLDKANKKIYGKKFKPELSVK